MGAKMLESGGGELSMSMSDTAGLLNFDEYLHLETYSSIMFSIKKWYGNYILSPILLAGSLAIFLFAPEALFKKGIHTYVKDLSFRFLKRSIDIIGAIVGLILSAIFFCWVPILIKLTSKGPIIYKQKRIGFNRRNYTKLSGWSIGSYNRRNGDRRRINVHGMPFILYKFRTMKINAESACGPIWAEQNDPRVTKIGNWLRKYHIDEIPQFLNILKGEMSLVGPRPERPFIVYQLSKKVIEYPKRHRVKPGLTGLAQLKNGYDTDEKDIRKKIKYDLEYIQNNTILMDIKILLLTAKHLLLSHNGEMR